MPWQPGGGFEDNTAPERTDPTVGSIATVIGTYQWGPRPGQPNNCDFADEYDVMEDPEERRRRREGRLKRCYGLWDCGPIYCPPYRDEHGKDWAPFTDWVFSRDISIFYARMRELLDAGFRLNYYAIPEAGPFVTDDGDLNWTNLDRYLRPIYESPEFQVIMKDAEITIAWEPRWKSAKWVKAAQWVRSIFKTHNIRVHMDRGHSAPGDGKEGEAECWQAIAPYVDGCDFQSSPVLDLPSLDDIWQKKATGWQTFIFELWDIGRRLKHGIGGWPTKGFMGRPMTLRAKEFASWWVARGLKPESLAIEMGNAALSYPPFIHPDTGDHVDVRGLVEMVGDGRTVSL